MIEVFDGKWYARTATRFASNFASAHPFPHVVIDNFLPHFIASEVARLYPQPGESGWTHHDHERSKRYFLGDITKMKPSFREFALACNSRSFLLFLEALTGIDGLIPDPYFIGGGAMAAGRGDFLKMHADFNWHYRLRCWRRLNALFYLTPDWKPEWGGELRLEGDSSSQVILPLFNRLVVFEVSDTAIHGQPVPLTCPEGEYRRVFSAFYYTSWSTQEEKDPHLTKYQQETPYTHGPIKAYKEAGAM